MRVLGGAPGGGAQAPAPPSREFEREAHRLRSRTWMIVGTYLGIAGLWILLSDRVLEWVVSDPADLVRYGSIKGLAFVTVTAILLLGLIRRSFRETLEAYQEFEANDRELKRIDAERSAALERLAEQARLLDQTQDAMVVQDPDGRVLFWNQGAERLHGWTAAEAVGQHVADLHCPDTAQLQEAMGHLESHGEWRGELHLVNRSGDALIAEARWTLLHRAHGAPRAILAVHTDVTGRRDIEAQFLRAQRSESIGTLAGGIAHDLNNLLAPIVSGVALLRLHPDDEATEEILDAIEASAHRGTDLVRQVLAFTQGIEGARVPVRLAEIVAEAVSMVSSTFPKAIVVHTDVADDLWEVKGDATQLHQVLMNLLVNARDALPHGGHVVVRARNEAADAGAPVADPGGGGRRHVVVEVSDDGVGMAPELVARIFEPFLTTKERGEGSGLGLSTVLGIVRSHGGAIDVTSEVDRGTSVVIHLPASDVEEVTRPSPAEQPDGGRHAAGDLVLVVDDEDLIVAMTRRVLESDGYRVVTADGGEAALRVFEEHAADLVAVITDLEMPSMSGAALIDALRAIDADVPIIATSGGVPSAGEVPVSDQHLAFMAKPSTPDQLLRLLASMLGAVAG